jgi:glyoxylate reductase
MAQDTTIGILGLGWIGRKTARHLKSFGFKLQYHNRKQLPDDEAEGAIYRESLEELFRTSDVISVHVPLSDSTHHLVSTTELSYLKRGSVLVNTARGPVVDEEALVEALKSGQLAAVGLDVFE